MSEFDHWYTKEDYEALERKKDAEIYRLKKKITAVKDAIEGVESIRNNQLHLLGLQQQASAYQPLRLTSPLGGGNGFVSGCRSWLGF